VRDKDSVQYIGEEMPQKIFVWKSKRRQIIDIKMDLKEFSWEHEKRIELAQDYVQW
jgi:hypothetical protein